MLSRKVVIKYVKHAPLIQIYVLTRIRTKYFNKVLHKCKIPLNLFCNAKVLNSLHTLRVVFDTVYIT